MVGDPEDSRISLSDLFVDSHADVLGSRLKWVSETVLDPIDEKGNPYPMGEWVLWDEKDYRHFNCRRYDACLTHTRDLNWVGFSCSRCEHCSVGVASVPDDPGPGYRKNDAGDFFIPSRYRFDSSAAGICECGNRLLEGDEMCFECGEELRKIMKGWYD